MITNAFHSGYTKHYLAWRSKSRRDGDIKNFRVLCLAELILYGVYYSVLILAGAGSKW